VHVISLDDKNMPDFLINTYEYYKEMLVSLGVNIRVLNINIENVNIVNVSIPDSISKENVDGFIDNILKGR
jgi:hypothetical protein